MKQQQLGTTELTGYAAGVERLCLNKITGCVSREPQKYACFGSSPYTSVIFLNFLCTIL
jgi:hypothetical protein